MSVQAAVAWLNKNNSSNSNTSTRKNQTLAVPLRKRDPAPPQGPRTKDIDATRERIRTPSGNGDVASLLTKFDSSGASTIQTVATSRIKSSSVLDSKSKPATLTATHNTDLIIHDLIQMFQSALDQCEAAQGMVRQMQGNGHKQQQHQSDIIKSTESECALIRDYEIRIKYLSDKVEQLSAEHNDLERQLALYRDPDIATIAHVTIPPVTPDLATDCRNDDEQRRTTIGTKSTRQSGESDDFWNCLLDSYEKEGSVGTEVTTDGEDIHADHKVLDREATSEQLLFVQKQVVELEKGARLMFERQARELHSEQSQNRYLVEVVEKQGQLIHVLEQKLSMIEDSKDQFLLQEQIELQQDELEDKRALLGRLLDEREEILQQQHLHQHHHQRINPNRSRSASVRSSIDILSEMSKTESNSKYPLSRTSSSSLQHSIHSSSTYGRSTPPPTAPPRNPLPPLPYKTSLSIRGSLSSAADPASSLSPATSWSSTDYASISRTSDFGTNTAYRDIFQQQHQQQRIISAINNPAKMIVPSAYSSTPLVNRQSTGKFSSKKDSRTSSIHSNTTFWKGWKQRLGSRS